MYLCAVKNILSEIMPRQERLQSATGIYHVMLRGINKQDIFEDDEDYIQFLKILNGLVVRPCLPVRINGQGNSHTVSL